MKDYNRGNVFVEERETMKENNRTTIALRVMSCLSNSREDCQPRG